MTGRVHVVVGSPWRDAVLKLLEPRSAYRPWPSVQEVHDGDGVLVVFDTEPRLALTHIVRVGADCDVNAAIAALRRGMFNDTVSLSLLGVDVDGRYVALEGADAARVVAAVDTQRVNAPRDDRFGHSSAAAARVLLESDGRCTGCDTDFDLIADVPAVRAVNSAEDWPAALCTACQTALRDSGFDSFLTYGFSLHPSCPRCGARRTQGASFGMPAAMFETVPWSDHRGCCVANEDWTCSVCDHQW